ncbi:MAG: glycosyltransferase [Candidatus Competibacteraceae bacterium]
MTKGSLAPAPQTTAALPPLASIVIRSMGRATLRQALDSVAGQNYPHLEIVVVNAKGKGHPPLPEHYGRIPLRVCNAGQPLPRSRAANLGMERARGDYLLFLDDDDWLLPHHVNELAMALQRQPHLRIAYTGVECQREADGRRETVLVYNSPFDAIRLLYENYIPIHAVLFERRLFLEGCRFDETLDVYEDWDFWLQLRATGPFSHVDQVSAIYRLNSAENLGGTAQQGLLITAWSTIIHKWRHLWSDDELRAICTQARGRQTLIDAFEQERRSFLADRHSLMVALEQEKQVAETGRHTLTVTLEQEKQAAETERQTLMVALEQEKQAAETERQTLMVALEQEKQAAETGRHTLMVALEQEKQAAETERHTLMVALEQEKQVAETERQTLMVALQQEKQAAETGRHTLMAALEQEKQTAEAGRQAQEKLTTTLERDQAQHQETVATLQQRLETLAKKLVQEQQMLEMYIGGLAAVESSTIWCASYPYRWLMIQLQQILRRSAPEAVSDSQPGVPINIPCPPIPYPVDVIIPIYRGLDETRACLESVLATVPAEIGNLIVINDASPELKLVIWLTRLAEQYPQLMVLHNPGNLGFVQTCNRGMGLHPERDVVLLNSDTVVANDWLARLRDCAYRDRRIGTVTPFSNNATICSYPRFCADNPLPPGWPVAALDALFSRCNRGELADIPTAVGFCMYIRRGCLNEVGGFDERHFGKGYGEENDFSMRAKALGWRHALSADVFVYHAGSVSFADHQNHQKRQGLDMVSRLHPDYEPLVHRHIAQDPARPFRLRVDLARLTYSERPVLLFITHDRGGGTQKHIEELVEMFAADAQFLLLRPGGNGQHLLSWPHPGEALQLIFNLPGDSDALQNCLQALAVRRIHFHHTIGLHPLLLELPARLGVPYDFTVHDYYPCCPQITLTNYQNRYCGEPDTAGCNRCLAILPAPGGGTIQTWRQRYKSFITQADRVLAPCADAARRLARYFPAAHILPAPHPDLDDHACPAPQPTPLLDDEPLRIVVLGALSPIKGADVLEQCALNARLRGLPLTFELIGYAYRHLRTAPGSALKVHGAYDNADLPAFLSKAQPHLVWFPALWPETYSYTLSTCLHLGLPVVVPDLGAFPERLAGRAWSWICPWRQPARDWNDFFVRIREQHFAPGCSPPAPDGETGPPGFDYRRDYLPPAILTTPADRVMTDADAVAMATTFAYPHLTGTAQQQAALRLKLLDMTVRLRRAPLLHRLARAIPLGWQSRVKAWLRGTLS